jgi:hypothetical protein
MSPALKVVEDEFAQELECVVCQGPFVTPVSINCGHTFCCSCLHTYWSTKQENAQTCPLCRQLHTGPWAVNTWVEKLVSISHPNSNEASQPIGATTKGRYLYDVVLKQHEEQRSWDDLHKRLNTFHGLVRATDGRDSKKAMELLCYAAAIVMLFRANPSVNPTILGAEARFVQALQCLGTYFT